MKTATIRLEKFQDGQDFVNIVSKYDYDVDLVSGRYIIDAKSLMGVFSLSMLKPVTLQAWTDDATALFEELKPYIVKE